MDEKTRKLQELLQSVHAAIAALDELTFLMHTAYRSPAALEAQRVAQDLLQRADRRPAASPSASTVVLPKPAPSVPHTHPGQ